MTRIGLLAAALLLAACSSEDGCTEPADCHDLVLHGESYDEYQVSDETRPPGELEEVGNATYPECNCQSGDFDGFGATDVWRAGDLDPADAVLGLRPGTHTYVVYVRVGVDPESLSLPAP